MRPDPSISPYSQVPYPPQYPPTLGPACMCSFMMFIFWAMIMASWIVIAAQGELNNNLTFGSIMFGMGAPFFVSGTCCCCCIRRERSRHRKRMKEYSQTLEEMRLAHQSNLPIQVITPAENLVNCKVLLM